jgi:hypothetical protein
MKLEEKKTKMIKKTIYKKKGLGGLINMPGLV